jgi:Fic family protein
MQPSALEPTLPEDRNQVLENLAVELVAKSSQLAGQVKPEVRDSIGDLVRSMNCYYSNLIEGHNTHPRDIDSALHDRYSEIPEKRALQQEALAHIEVQRMMDAGAAPDVSPTSVEYIRWIHSEFCRRLPEDLLWVKNTDTGQRIRVVPGEFRDGPVQVGRHIPPPADDIEKFLNHFSEAFHAERLSSIRRIVSVAAAHHRFVWIHPFYDGNGRVVRLMSHSMLLKYGVGSSLWSVSRGLARSNEEYRARLMAADSPRQGDFDGRGTLSDQHLQDFCEYFLRACIDQVEFMESLLQPAELLRRMKIYCDDEEAAGRLPKRSMALLREAYLVGQFERGRAAEVTGYQERRAREILAHLLKVRLLVSSGPKAPVRLGFPLNVVERWFPALYPVN